MEIYGKAQVRISEGELQRFIDVGNLPEWCASIEEVISTQGSRGEIRTAWGEATIHRELINGGIRFSCPDNPHAMQWSITVSRARPAEVLLHLTTNCAGHDSEEAERLTHFVEQWRSGLERWPQRRLDKRRKPCVKCYDSFGGFG